MSSPFVHVAQGIATRLATAKLDDLAGARVVNGPWSFMYSVARLTSGSPKEHMLTAKVRSGCGTTPHDWQVLGGVAASLGAPEDALRTNIGEGWEPHQTIRWMWSTQD